MAHAVLVDVAGGTDRTDSHGKVREETQQGGGQGDSAVDGCGRKCTEEGGALAFQSNFNKAEGREKKNGTGNEGGSPCHAPM